MKVAIIHYWWLSNRGGESVIKELIDIFPDADLFTHVCDESLVRRSLGDRFSGKIKTTFISRLPFSKKHYQKYLPLMPIALEQLDLQEYDLIISSESGPAKGVISRPEAIHICYCHSPMRYIWDMAHEYIKSSRWPIRFTFPLIAHWLRVWDESSAARVDVFIANSNYIAKRIKKFYRRESNVIHPPVDVEGFTPSTDREDFYLCLGQLVPYKRADIAIEAFNQLKLPLVVIGEGELFDRLKNAALPNVRLLGRQPFEVVKQHLEKCKALVFPGVEDFGIVPVEAMAAGAPVIAFKGGGALDTVIDGVNGFFFEEQTIDSLKNAVVKFEMNSDGLNVENIKATTERFSRSRFRREIIQAISSAKNAA